MRGAEYIDVICKNMSEDELQGQVMQMAHIYGYFVYHTHDSRRSPGGFPDLCMARPGRIIFAELKSERGRFRPGQQEWLERLGTAAETYLWKPRDLLDGSIQSVLTRCQQPEFPAEQTPE